MRISRNRIMTIIVFCVMLLVFGLVIFQNARFAEKDDESARLTSLIDGKYSIDGGEWKETDNKKPINEHFRKAVFKGNFAKEVGYYFNMFVTSKNVWYTIRYPDGTEFYTNRRDNVSELPEGSAEKPENQMLSTPGYSVRELFIDSEMLAAMDKEMTLEIEYPYEFGSVSLSDCFYVTLSFSDGMYLRFFFDALPVVLICLLVCFFGVFFFPIASVILGRFDTKYIAFGALCFCSGFYFIMRQIGEYLNLWIHDSTVCMMTDKLSGYFLAVSVIFYFKSVLSGKAAKRIAGITGVVFVVLMIAAAVLHLTNTADMVATSAYMVWLLAAAAALLTALLCINIRNKRNWELLGYLMSWAPIVVFLLLDFANIFINIRGVFFMRIGIALTILYQMVRFGIDLRRQYLEAIRYQQVQRELYEAKVSVMVSQIRPHFMYNALSSIAILCKLSPDTAYDAAVTFSDYLRGNMDSLKQTAPVPFSKELEHLKKYLYIEKLRFDDQLNIEYDIKTTDFELPLLSIQPLVENAVKHGVGMKEDGGTVKISTRETDSAYEVIIEDDGVGFDIHEKKDDGRSHVGMENTKKRLHDMCGGEVIIASNPGKGTTARVIIPKKEENEK